MSDEALKIYEESRKHQLNRSEARRIRIRVSEARKGSHRAALRWPFELLQNALDAGPRPGRTHVNVSVRCDSSTIVFEHDGAPFTTSELAALLSGGSSKEFESEKTTGRFGTGFLVTHVLSEQTTLRALLKVENSYEQFELTLDRSGDEDAILENIRSCSGAIAAATRVKEVDAKPSTRFDYHLSDPTILQLGIESLQQALPYLYATRHTLGQVHINNGVSGPEEWSPSDPLEMSIEHGSAVTRDLQVNNDSGQRLMRSVRFESGSRSSAAIVVLDYDDEGWTALPAGASAPKIFREYPIRDSAFVPIAFVLDGKFSPNQERERLNMDDDDKELLEEALSAATLAINTAVQQSWKNAHLLGSAAPVASGFDPNDESETTWWNETLRVKAEAMARLPIVQCKDRLLPALSDAGSFADFISPRLSPSSVDDDTTVDRVWPLFASATSLDPPIRELATARSEIASGWKELGVEVQLHMHSRRPNGGCCVPERLAPKSESPALCGN